MHLRFDIGNGANHNQHRASGKVIRYLATGDQYLGNKKHCDKMGRAGECRIRPLNEERAGRESDTLGEL